MVILLPNRSKLYAAKEKGRSGLAKGISTPGSDISCASDLWIFTLKLPHDSKSWNALRSAGKAIWGFEIL